MTPGPVVLAAADISTAIITVGGALLGVLVGGAINAYVQDRSERRKAARLARTGARLLWAEWTTAAHRLNLAEQDELWHRETQLTSPSWSTYREPLANTVTGNEWEILASAITSLERTSNALEQLVGESAVSSRLRKDTLDDVKLARERISVALVVLRQLAGVDDGPAASSETTPSS